ncbi:hypothetical protein [Actinocrispum sp. NPDC049592]|uniref:hypothetical protein n=1 Tax=Actinocrispum sp. NPDC049592 TaxID=3154835 RepID=UPI00341D6737
MLDRHVAAAVNGRQVSRDPLLPPGAGDSVAFLPAGGRAGSKREHLSPVRTVRTGLNLLRFGASHDEVVAALSHRLATPRYRSSA